RTRFWASASPPASLEDVAGRSFGNQAVSILAKEKSLRDRFLRRRFHLIHILAVAAVALLEGETRVAGGGAVLLRLGERNEAAVEQADLALIESVGSDVPARVRSERHLSQHGGNSSEVIAVRIHLGHERGKHLLDHRRLFGDQAGFIDVIEV